MCGFVWLFERNTNTNSINTWDSLTHSHCTLYRPKNLWALKSIIRFRSLKSFQTNKPSFFKVNNNNLREVREYKKKVKPFFWLGTWKNISLLIFWMMQIVFKYEHNWSQWQSTISAEWWIPSHNYVKKGHFSGWNYELKAWFYCSFKTIFSYLNSHKHP